MSEIRIEQRIEELKEAFIDGELSEEDFDTLLDAALDDDAPFRADWFMRQPETRRKRYAERDIYLYKDEEYEVDGDLVVPAEIDDEERVISARGDSAPEGVEFRDASEIDPPPEVKEKQEELKEKMLSRQSRR